MEHPHMTNKDLVIFAETWKVIGDDAQEMIGNIVVQNGDLHSALLEQIDAPTLRRALDELRACNVPSLVREIDAALEEVECYQQEKTR